MGLFDYANSVPFVLAQMDVGITYAGFACEPYLDPTYRDRYRDHAQKVHDSVVKFLSNATLTGAERIAIVDKLDLLSTAIGAIPTCE